jgi:hypothetical protein
MAGTIPRNRKKKKSNTEPHTIKRLLGKKAKRFKRKEDWGWGG